MHLSKLILDDFRSYDELTLDLSPGTTTFLGPNGSGKTNIVEAMRYLGTLSSHRVASDAPMVRKGSDRATVRGLVHRAGRTLAVEVSIALKGANTARLNGVSVKPREVAHVLRTVVFSPEDLSLVKGEPAGRRAFIDELTVAMSPTMAGTLADYDRIVRQKSALLKSMRGRAPTGSTLEVWNEKLADTGARVLSARVETITALGPYVSTAYADVAAGEDSMSMTYISGINVEEAIAQGGDNAVRGALLQEMTREGERERERGMCLVGPHRDDLAIDIGGLPARGYASHGESWSAALALRLATFDLLTIGEGPDSGEDGEPVLILDDVFAELDGGRRQALAKKAAKARQVIVTAAVGSDVPAVLGGIQFVIDDGKVVSNE